MYQLHAAPAKCGTVLRVSAYFFIEIGAVVVPMNRALGKLVLIHLPPRPTPILLLARSVPRHIPGSSCVAPLDLVVSMTSATHGALFLVLAIAACPVGVRAESETKTTSGTSTEPPQLPRVHAHGDVVDVAAKLERGRVYATPTASLSIASAAMVFAPSFLRPCTADRLDLSSSDLDGNSNSERHPILLSGAFCAPAAPCSARLHCGPLLVHAGLLIPGLLLAIVPPPASCSVPTPPPFWDEASAEAGRQGELVVS